MKNIFENPYRIIGVVANASEKDLQQRKSKIQAFARIGKAIDSEFDFSFLPAIERNSEQIERAFASIEQAQDKVNHALFWFINATPIDVAALGHLKSGDTEKALEIWGKITIGKTITAKNFSAFLNFSTLHLCNNNSFKEGLAFKTQLVESEAFTNFVHLVADQTATVDTQKQLEWLIEEFLIALKGKSDVLSYFSLCSTQVQQLVAKHFTQEPIHLVETEVAKAEKGRKDTPRNAYQIGKTLFAATKVPLSELQKILGSNDLNYKRLSDNVAKTLTQCSIDYVNALQETSDPFDQGLELLKWAETLAINSLTRERIADNKKTLGEIADRARNREINEAIMVLKGVKEALKKTEKDIEKELERIYGFEDYGLGRISRVPIEVEIQISSIAKKQINWDKVVEVVKKVITPEAINKIKTNKDSSKIEEYKKLVEFVLENLTVLQKTKIGYICYWKLDLINGLSSVMNKNINQVSNSNSKGGCYIATMAYGSYEHPQVLELRKFRDEVLASSLLGRLFIKIYYFISPKLVHLLKEKQGINRFIRYALDNFVKALKQ